MDLIISSKEDLEKLMQQVIHKELSNLITQLQVGHSTQEWIRTREVRTKYNISSSTIQNFRNSGILPFSKVKGTIFYKISDVENLLQNNIKVK